MCANNGMRTQNSIFGNGETRAAALCARKRIFRFQFAANSSNGSFASRCFSYNTIASTTQAHIETCTNTRKRWWWKKKNRDAFFLCCSCNSFICSTTKLVPMQLNDVRRLQYNYKSWCHNACPFNGRLVDWLTRAECCRHIQRAYRQLVLKFYVNTFTYSGLDVAGTSPSAAANAANAASNDCYGDASEQNHMPKCNSFRILLIFFSFFQFLSLSTVLSISRPSATVALWIQ